MTSSPIPLSHNRRVMGDSGGGAHALEATLLAPFLGASSAPAARPSFASQPSAASSVQRSSASANHAAAAVALSPQPDVGRKGSALPPFVPAATSGIGSSHSPASSPSAHAAASVGSPVMPYSVVAAKAAAAPMPPLSPCSAFVQSQLSKRGAAADNNTPSPSSSGSRAPTAAAAGSNSNSPQLSSTEVFPPLSAAQEMAASSSRRGSRTSPSLAGLSNACSPSMPALELPLSLPRSSSPAGRPQWRTYRLSAFQAAELSSPTLPPAAASTPASAAAVSRSSALNSHDMDDGKHNTAAPAAPSAPPAPVATFSPLPLATDPSVAMDDEPPLSAAAAPQSSLSALTSPTDIPVAVFYNDNRIHLVDHFTLGHFAHGEDATAEEAEDPRLLIRTIPAELSSADALPNRKFDSSPMRFLDSPLTIAVAPKNNSSPAFDFARDVISARGADQCYSSETMLQPSSYSTQIAGEEALDEWQDPGSAAHLASSLTHSPRSSLFGVRSLSMALRTPTSGELMIDEQLDAQADARRLSYSTKAHESLRQMMGRAFGIGSGEASAFDANPEPIEDDDCIADEFEVLSPE